MTKNLVATDIPEIKIAEFRAELGRYLESAHHSSRVQIVKHKRPYATVVSVDDGEILSELDSVAKAHGLDKQDILSKVRSALERDKTSLTSG